MIKLFGPYYCQRLCISSGPTCSHCPPLQMQNSKRIAECRPWLLNFVVASWVSSVNVNRRYFFVNWFKVSRNNTNYSFNLAHFTHRRLSGRTKILPNAIGFWQLMQIPKEFVPTFDNTNFKLANFVVATSN